MALAQIQPQAAAVVYLRISDDEHGDADAVLNRQKPDCLSFCERSGIEVSEILIDNDISASRYGRKRREAYERALELVRTGQVNTIVSWHLDRLYRQVRELEALITLVEDAKGAVQIQTLSGDYDVMNPDHRFNLRMQISVAEKESDDKSRRLRRKHLQIAEAGGNKGGGRGFGHSCSNSKGCLTVGCSHDGRSAIPVEADAIRWAAGQILDGFSVKSVQRTWNTAAAVANLLGRQGVCTPRPKKDDDGNVIELGGQWHAAVIGRCLISPRLAGFREHKGAIVRDAEGNPVQAVEPILDVATWERLRALLTGPNRRRPIQVRRHPIGGLAFCGRCGKRLVVGPTNGAPALRCQRDSVPGACGRLVIKLEPLMNLVRDGAFAKLLHAPDLVTTVEEPEDDHAEALARLEGLRRSLEELDENRWVLRTIDQATWARMRGRVEAEIDKISSAITPTTAVPKLRDLPTTAEGMLEAWNTRGVEWQRAILLSVFERIDIQPAAHKGARFTSDRVVPTFRARH